MAKKPNVVLDDEDDIATDWPMTSSYTTTDGHIVKVYKRAYAAVSSNKFSARPKKAHNVIGI